MLLIAWRPELTFALVGRRHLLKQNRDIRIGKNGRFIRARCGELFEARYLNRTHRRTGCGQREPTQ